MYLIVTRSFPPDVGGMQNLIWGLSRELSKNYIIKVFAEYKENHKKLRVLIGLIFKHINNIWFNLKNNNFEDFDNNSDRTLGF